MTIQMTHENRAESPAQQAGGLVCVDESAWRQKFAAL